ncbi:iron-siderophore ABC transporter substrate-binding protein [Terracoccus luteus]|uniref:Iron complex transport system substrate-binding protein n=1 Tax=Terracoccus luteus TaxID=53356 RepID=A0A839Q2V8_9MICO|nr:iron-siderophore ABC transporter substrate-binding protein [Terracoccus luteus]MBB2986971.1 iron complex transport system substrate-binding protein [Terracoccus luteus]MCP2172622.1 iron complex transport system substrate-binding protein [Terracoccus luteus]
MLRLRSALPVAALPAAVALLVLAGCSTGPSGSTTVEPGAGGSTSQADANAFPVTITHAFGKATINAAPKRVVTLGWTDADHVAALGVAPVGAPKVTWGGNAKQSSDWFDKQLAAIGGAAPTRFDDADGAPIEEIAKLNPDLILATNSGITKVEYDKLSKLAPVVAYPKVAWGTPWEESLDLIGTALGRSGKAAEVKAQTEQTLEAARTKYPQLAGKTFIYAFVTPTDYSQVGYYTPLDLRPRMLTELGMKNAPVIEKLSEGSSEFYKTVSAEQAPTLASDILLTYVEQGDEVANMKKDPLIGQIPAVKAGAVVATADKRVGLTTSSPSPLSIPFMVDLFVPTVAEAVAKADAS